MYTTRYDTRESRSTNEIANTVNRRDWGASHSVLYSVHDFSKLVSQ